MKKKILWDFELNRDLKFEFRFDFDFYWWVSVRMLLFDMDWAVGLLTKLGGRQGRERKKGRDSILSCKDLEE